MFSDIVRSLYKLHGRFVNLRSVEILKAIGSLLGETCSVLRYKLAFPGGSEPQVSLRNN